MSNSSGAVPVDIVVESYVHAPEDLVVDELTSLGFWRAFDADIRLERYHDRGSEGMRWYLTGSRSGVVGTAEVWLEPYGAGTIAHLFVRGTGQASRRSTRRSRRAVRGADRRLRRAMFTAKDRLERCASAQREPHRPGRTSESGSADGRRADALERVPDRATVARRDDLNKPQR